VESRIRYFGYAGGIDSAGVTRIAAALNAAVNEILKSREAQDGLARLSAEGRSSC